MGLTRKTDAAAAGIEAMYTPLQAVVGKQWHVQQPQKQLQKTQSCVDALCSAECQGWVAQAGWQQERRPAHLQSI